MDLLKHLLLKYISGAKKMNIMKNSISINSHNTLINKFLSLAISMIFLVVLHSSSYAQYGNRKENLKGKWRFSLGDNKKFADPDYDHSRWEWIDVPSSWEREGFKEYDGYAWYRKEIKMDLTSGKNLFVHLGRIDDTDEVFLNGVKIGGLGAFPPRYTTAYNQERIYKIPKSAAKKKGNILAVRVYDNIGPGGIKGYKVGIYEHDRYANEVTYLNGNWKFHLFDKPEWADPDFDDSAWEEIVVPTNWDEQGFASYDGIAWYRKTFVLSKDYHPTELMVMLGKIDDMDETYINGQLIGSTGNLDYEWDGHSYTEAWAKKRNYMIPDDLLRPGKKNVIAVRVYDHHDQGGIYEGPVAIIPSNQYKSFQEYHRKNNLDHIIEWVEYLIEDISDEF